MLEPIHAIVFFQDKENNTQVEFYDVDEGRLTSPRPLSRDAALSIRNFVFVHEDGGNFIHGQVTPSTLYVSAKRLIWYRPASETIIPLERKDSVVNKKVFLPPMVFDYKVSPRELFTYWSTGDIKCIQKDEKCLVGAPMPNIGVDGNVCLGTSMVKMKEVFDIASIIAQVERHFMGSTFNEWRYEHIGHAIAYCEKMAPEYKKDVPTFLDKLWKGKTTFKELNRWVKTNSYKSLSQVIQRN